MSTQSANHEHMTFLGILWQTVGLSWRTGGGVAQTQHPHLLLLLRKHFPGILRSRVAAGIRGGGGMARARTLLLRGVGKGGGVGSPGQLHCLCVYKHFAVAITKTVSCA